MTKNAWNVIGATAWLIVALLLIAGVAKATPPQEEYPAPSDFIFTDLEALSIGRTLICEDVVDNPGVTWDVPVATTTPTNERRGLKIFVLIFGGVLALLLMINAIRFP
ncbi:hypothetical protein KJ742_04435 [Patescibacteria group bacterium]|nr:hypothetical protein [Patescibacteria group bacterium]MBU1683166.1 hypothetical protein [Patescibacteria group bacterium]MBU1935297.1 hypothetical protein [Patescibacteria group bacterium]